MPAYKVGEANGCWSGNASLAVNQHSSFWVLHWVWNKITKRENIRQTTSYRMGNSKHITTSFASPQNNIWIKGRYKVKIAQHKICLDLKAGFLNILSRNFRHAYCNGNSFRIICFKRAYFVPFYNVKQLFVNRNSSTNIWWYCFRDGGAKYLAVLTSDISPKSYKNNQLFVCFSVGTSVVVKVPRSFRFFLSNQKLARTFTSTTLIITKQPS